MKLRTHVQSLIRSPLKTLLTLLLLAAAAFLFLYNLSEYCGCRDKLEGKPLEECAFVIATEYYYLKVSELMLFFHRFKTGSYGRFYGSVDALVITTSLREFIRERGVAIERHDQEVREKEEAEHCKRVISYEEYLRRKES